MKLEIDIQEVYDELKVIIQHKELNDEVQEVITQIKARKDAGTLVGYGNEKMQVMKPEDIHRFYGQDGKVFAVVNRKEYIVRKKLYELEEILKNKGFVRISKGSIVNLSYVNSIETTFDGALSIVLDNGNKDMISRRYVKKVKTALGIGGQ